MKKLVAILIACLILTSVGFATSQEETTTTTTPTLGIEQYYLSSYPDYFFDAEGNFVTIMAVGSGADAMDVVGAIDVMARLAGDSVEEVAVPSPEIVVGRQKENIPLGSPIAKSGLLDQVLTDNEVEGLLDTSIDFQDESYDIHEEIRIGIDSTTNSPMIHTSLTSNEEDYEDDVFMELERNALSYYYVFDDDINISAVTEDDPLEIDFLGQTLTITKTHGDDGFTAQLGEKIFMTEGETKVVAGKSITLDAVAEDDKVIIIVDGEKEIVGTSQKLIKGIKIKVLMSFASTKEAIKGMARLLVGTEIEEKYEDDDEFIGESKSDPEWVWQISGLDPASLTPEIGIMSEMVKNDFEDEPAKEGDCYIFPNKYVSVCFNKLTVEEDDYAIYELEYRDSENLEDAGYADDEKVFRFTSSEDDGIILDEAGDWDGTPAITGIVKTDKIYILAEDTMLGEVSVFYIDKDNDVAYAGTVTNDGSADENVIGYINYRSTKGDNTLPLAFLDDLTNNDLQFAVQDAVLLDDDIKAWLNASNGDFTSLGEEEGESEPTELKWDTTSIGSKESDLRTKYGIQISNPDNYGSSDKVNLKIPADQVEAIVYVEGTGVEVTGGEVGYYYKAKIIGQPVAKLDNEVPDPATIDENLILIGGSCANSLVQKLVDNGKLSADYSCAGGIVGAGWKAGEGYLFVVPDAFKTGQIVMVVAGTTATDTRNACLALQNYDLTIVNINALNAKITSPTSVVAM